MNMEWISVKDRMPEKHVMVILANSDRVAPGYLEQFGLFFVVLGGNDRILGQATHWMPLPPPPKEGE